MNFNQTLIPFLLTLLAGLSTVFGSILFLQNFCRKKYLGFFLGLSAGVMIYLSFMELLPVSVEQIGILNSSLYFFLGIIIIGFVDFLLPHQYIGEKICKRQQIFDPKLLSTGLVVTLGLIIHNIPEGMAVFLSSFSDLKLGVLLAFAIAVHNIPEGIAVAAPIYFATKSKTKAIQYSFISGIAEPLGAIIAYFILKPYLSQNLLAYIFAVVAGIMVYISFDELLPASFRDNQGYSANLGIVTGMVIVSVSLLFL